jgi:O-methyltransferase
MRANELYLDLIKRSVSNFLYLGKDRAFNEFKSIQDGRYQGYKWNIPRDSQPHSLLSAAQLDLLEELILKIEREKIPGDFIEAGIWRGGAVIFMRAVLEAYSIPDRKIYAADSFEGIPYNEKIKGDPVDAWQDRWQAGFEEVAGNISRYGLLDDRIEFIRGYFNDSLATAKIGKLALVRLDADSHDSTTDALTHLYPKLSQGGAIIIDDWHLPGCRLAVKEFREAQKIVAPINFDAPNKYWIKE